MKNDKTPKPGSESYDVENPQELTRPKYNSTTQRKSGDELPLVENLDDQKKKMTDEHFSGKDLPKTDLGNKRSDDEEEREKIITP